MCKLLPEPVLRARLSGQVVGHGQVLVAFPPVQADQTG